MTSPTSFLNPFATPARPTTVGQERTFAEAAEFGERRSVATATTTESDHKSGTD
jgi:hypothetical protein